VLAIGAVERLFELLRSGLAAGASPPAWYGWVSGLSWAVSQSLSFAVAEAFALWGRRWPPEWRIWIVGKLVVRALAYGASSVLRSLLSAALLLDVDLGLPYGLIMAAVNVCSGAIDGAGTAWLLDRCAFRREAEEAPRA
jgi:hypothetical protein